MIDKIRYRPYGKRTQRKHTNAGLKRHGRQRPAIVQVMLRSPRKFSTEEKKEYDKRYFVEGVGPVFLEWWWKDLDRFEIEDRKEYPNRRQIHYVDFGTIHDLKKFLGGERWRRLKKGKKRFHMNIFVGDFFFN